MNTRTDQDLLREYSERRSEVAFAELVRRYVDLIYSASRRMVCDAHLAEDVTQRTFVALAQNAGRLTDCRVLSGWLHRTAKNIAAKSVRSDVRRRAREQEAVAMNVLLSAEADPAWEHIARHLDAALGELSDSDRDAVLLRYFERKSAHEMAGILGVSDEAAQKRVTRAVDRLRDFLAKRGLAIGTGALVAGISANAVEAAPAGLAAAIATATVASLATATITKVIAMTTLQKALVTVTITAAVGTGIYEAHQARSWQERARILEQVQTSVREQSAQPATPQTDDDHLAQDNARLQTAIAASQTKIEKLKADLEKERAERKRQAVLADYQNLFGTAAIKALTEGVTNMPASLEEALTQASQALKDMDTLRTKYSKGRPSQGPEREQFDAEMSGLLERMASLATDKRLMSSLDSTDPDLKARCQLWLLAGALDLNASQVQQADQVLQQSYRDWFAQKLNMAAKPATEVETWYKARTDVSTTAYERINATLNPEQQKAFSSIFGKNFMGQMTMRLPGPAGR